MEYCPRLPDDIWRKVKDMNMSVALDSDEYMTWWYPDSSVNRIYNDGTQKYWYPKPTLADVVAGCVIWKGAYFRFHTNGIVECRLDPVTGTAIWHPGVNPTIETGNFIW
jgi:hypothetical protein